MVAIYSIGKSVENRQLWVTRISNEVAFSRKGNQQKRKQLKPMVKIVANMHGNEVLKDFPQKNVICQCLHVKKYVLWFFSALTND